MPAGSRSWTTTRPCVPGWISCAKRGSWCARFRPRRNSSTSGACTTVHARLPISARRPAGTRGLGQRPTEPAFLSFSPRAQRPVREYARAARGRGGRVGVGPAARGVRTVDVGRIDTAPPSCTGPSAGIPLTRKPTRPRRSLPVRSVRREHPTHPFRPRVPHGLVVTTPSHR